MASFRLARDYDTRNTCKLDMPSGKFEPVCCIVVVKSLVQLLNLLIVLPCQITSKVIGHVRVVTCIAFLVYCLGNELLRRIQIKKMLNVL